MLPLCGPGPRLADRKWLNDVNLGTVISFITKLVHSSLSSKKKKKKSQATSDVLHFMYFVFHCLRMTLLWCSENNCWYVGSYPEEQNRFVLQSWNRTVNVKWWQRTKARGSWTLFQKQNIVFYVRHDLCCLEGSSSFMYQSCSFLPPPSFTKQKRQSLSQQLLVLVSRYFLE